MAEKGKSNIQTAGAGEYRGRIIRNLFLIIVFTGFVLCIVFFWFHINSGTRRAMREARDIRIAMKMKAIEQYGLGLNGSIYQATARNGMVDGMEEEILSLADADGEIVLQSWDSDNNEPAAFTFQKDRYIIIFKQKEDGSAIWNGYYTLKLLSYE